jgi:hypothetical protein
MEILQGFYSVLCGNTKDLRLLSQEALLKRRELVEPTSTSQLELPQNGAEPMDTDLPDSMVIEEDPVLTSENTQVLLSVREYLDNLIDILITADQCRPNVVRGGPPTPLDEVASLLAHSSWFPSTLLAEQLSESLLESAQIINRGVCSKFVQRQRTIHQYTLPLFSLAQEEFEGYMNLITTIADMLQLNLPANVCTKDPLSCPVLDEMVNSFWKKVDDIIVTHKLSRMRVADVLLRAFAARITTHWSFFVSLFGKISFSNLDHVVGFLLRSTNDVRDFIKVPSFWFGFSIEKLI